MILINGTNESGYEDKDLEDVLQEQEFTLTITPTQFKKILKFIEDIQIEEKEILDARYSFCECVRPIFTIIGKNGTLVITDNLVKNISENNKVIYSLGDTKKFYLDRKDLNSNLIIEKQLHNQNEIKYKIIVRD